MAEKIDVQALAVELGFQAEDVRKLASMFFKSSAKALCALDEAVKRGDFEGIYRAAHSIKGSAGIVHLYDLKAFALEVENAGRNREAIDYAAAVKTLQEMVDTVEVV